MIAIYDEPNTRTDRVAAARLADEAVRTVSNDYGDTPEWLRGIVYNAGLEAMAAARARLRVELWAAMARLFNVPSGNPNGEES